MDGKKWTKEEILQGINTSTKWLTRGIVAVYRRQTEDEQRSATGRHHNKQGFTLFDAEFLTSIARQILAWRALSVIQVECSRKCMQKYAGQLTKIANATLYEVCRWLRKLSTVLCPGLLSMF
jgi:hypothetical protein